MNKDARITLALEAALLRDPHGEEYLARFLPEAMCKPGRPDCWQAELMRHTATLAQRRQALRSFYIAHPR